MVWGEPNVLISKKSLTEQLGLYVVGHTTNETNVIDSATLMCITVPQSEYLLLCSNTGHSVLPKQM